MIAVWLLTIFLAAYAWAKLEVEIEGQDGWAARLPTWRRDDIRIARWMLNGRPLTGYHLWAFASVFLFFHLVLLGAATWTVALECRILGSIFLFWVFEDFLWFLVNPHFGWKRYGPAHVPWHPKWILGFPADHWVLLLLGLVLLISSASSGPR